jgi:G3E family GTPase
MDFKNMSGTTSVVLITGFLGSGKTTFLNRIINNFPKDLKLTVLMNEFGEIGIDGTLVEGDDIDMMEISRGSIFCVCVKTDFIKGLYELNDKIKPDLLIIESTGVANPADLKRDLQLPIFANRFEFAEQFCIIDAPHFLEAFEVFASVEKQLSTSTVFIINKSDAADREIVGKIKDIIAEHHPAPRIFETTYADIPLETFPSLFMSNKQEANDSESIPAETLSPQELEDFISTILENPELEATPPDQLASVTYVWHGKNLDEIKKMAEELPPSIVRAKGFIQGKEMLHLFNYVMGDWTLEPYTRDARETATISHKNMIVFIGTIAAIDNLHATLGGENWSAREVLQPFSQLTQM